MTELLSKVDLLRIAEYQKAVRRGTDEEIEDAADKLRAVNIDPDMAYHIIINRSEIEGDR